MITAVPTSFDRLTRKPSAYYQLRHWISAPEAQGDVCAGDVDWELPGVTESHLEAREGIQEMEEKGGLTLGVGNCPTFDP